MAKNVQEVQRSDHHFVLHNASHEHKVVRFEIRFDFDLTTVSFIRVVSVKFVFVLFRSRQQIVEKSQQIVGFLAEQFVGISKKAKVQQIVGEQFVEQISKFVSFCVLVRHMSKILIVFHSMQYLPTQVKLSVLLFFFYFIVLKTCYR